jgi:hypothetical protein
MSLDDDEGIDWTAVARVWAKEGSLADQTALMDWWAHLPARRAELAALRRWWDDAAALRPKSGLNALWKELRRRMHTR